MNLTAGIYEAAGLPSQGHSQLLSEFGLATNPVSKEMVNGVYPWSSQWGKVLWTGSAGGGF